MKKRGICQKKKKKSLGLYTASRIHMVESCFTSVLQSATENSSNSQTWNFCFYYRNRNMGIRRRLL